MILNSISLYHWHVLHYKYWYWSHFLKEYPRFNKYINNLYSTSIERAFIKTRNPFFKTALNAISKKIKKQIKNHRTIDIQNRIKSLQLNNDPKSWRTLKKEMGYPNKGSSYPDLKNGNQSQRQMELSWSYLQNNWNLCLRLKLILRIRI